MTPLSPGRYAFRFTGDEETAVLLQEAQELLSHAIAGGDVAAIFKRGLALLVADARRARHAASHHQNASRRLNQAHDGTRERVTAPAPAATSRLIPAAVQRDVWARDAGRCAFVGATGLRCEERRFLEYHHLKPWIVGGPATAENIALHCRAHNQHEARRYFAPIRSAMSIQ